LGRYGENADNEDEESNGEDGSDALFSSPVQVVVGRISIA